MKVLLVANYVNDRQVSMQRFAEMLASGLEAQGHDVRTLRPAPVLAGVRDTGRGISKWMGYLDKFVLFRRDLRRAADWADIVHICDHSNAAYTSDVANTPHLVTCHDLLAVRSGLGEVPQNPTRFTGRILQRMIALGLNSAQHVACPSGKTRADLLRLTKLPEARTSVVLNGLNYPFQPLARSEALRRLSEAGIEVEEPFVLHVGGDQWYKNRLGVVRIFEALRRNSGADASLILVGPELPAPINDFIRKAGIAGSVRTVQRCGTGVIEALYSLAEFLLFPSLEEGFGWPVIEAQACGCRVLTSDRPPLTEIGGPAAVYVEPEDPEEAGRAAARLLTEGPEERAARVENGLRHAHAFTAERMVREYVCLYEKLCGSNEGLRPPGAAGATCPRETASVLETG